MHFKQQENAIYFKIDHQEASNLLAGKIIKNYLSFNENYSIKQTLQTGEANSYLFDAKNNAQIIKVSNNQLAQELASRPSRKGIKIDSINGSTDIFLQVDLKSKPKE